MILTFFFVFDLEHLSASFIPSSEYYHETFSMLFDFASRQKNILNHEYNDNLWILFIHIGYLIVQCIPHIPLSPAGGIFCCKW